MRVIVRWRECLRFDHPTCCLVFVWGARVQQWQGDSVWGRKYWACVYGLKLSRFYKGRFFLSFATIVSCYGFMFRAIVLLENKSPMPQLSCKLRRDFCQDFSEFAAFIVLCAFHRLLHRGILSQYDAKTTMWKWGECSFSADVQHWT